MQRCSGAYKICQMDVSFGIQQHIIWLDISVHNALLMYVADCAAELGYPKANGFFGKGLS